MSFGPPALPRQFSRRRRQHAKVHRTRRPPRVRRGGDLGGRHRALGGAGEDHPGGAQTLRREPRPDRRGCARGDLQHPRDRPPARAPRRSGRGLEPGEDEGDSRGQGQDRQGRRPGPRPALGRGLSALVLAARRRDPRAAAPGRPPGTHRPSTHPAEEWRPRHPPPQSRAALSGGRPLRPQGPGLARRAGAAGRRAPGRRGAASTARFRRRGAAPDRRRARKRSGCADPRSRGS